MNERYVGLERVARWSVILLGAIVVVDAVAATSDLAEIRLLDRIVAGEPVTDSELDANDLRQAVLGGLQALLYVATAIVFIRWFRRAYRNLAPLGVTHPRFASWWTIAGWFIPIWSAFRPKQILNDIWRGSDPSAPPDSGSWRERDVPDLFLAWWLLFVVSTSADQVAFRLAFRGETPEDVRSASIAYLVTDLIDVVLAALAIVVVRRTTARQEAAAAARSTELGSPLTA